MKVLLPILVLFAAVCGTVLLVTFQPDAEEVAAERPITSVEVIQASPADVQLKINSQGTVLPQTEVDLIAEVSGQIIEVSPAFRTGADFKKGQVLVQIDPVDYEAAVASREAELATAQLNLEQEKALATQAGKDWDAMGAGEPSELTLRKPQLTQAEAAVKSAKALLAQAKRNLERTRIKAPFDGRILTKSADLGQYIAASASPVARIFATEQAELRLPLTAREAALLNQSQLQSSKVTCQPTDASSATTWTGHLDRLEGTIDPDSRLIYAVAVLDAPLSATAGEDSTLRRGLFVEAEIEGRTVPTAYTLPRYALRDSDSVYVVTEEHTLVSRQVAVVQSSEDTVIIDQGIEPGERIATSPIAYFVEGMPVTILAE